MLRCLLKMYEELADDLYLENFTVSDSVCLGYQDFVLLCFSRRL